MTGLRGCSECDEVRLEADHCLAHVTDAEFALVLQRLRDGQPLDARGVEITGRLSRLLDALQVDDPPQVTLASFEDARFIQGVIHFERTGFVADAHFERAQFCGGDAQFNDARFCECDARVDEVRFGSVAHFDDAQFDREADNRKAQFSGEADFRRILAEKARLGGR